MKYYIPISICISLIFFIIVLPALDIMGYKDPKTELGLWFIIPSWIICINHLLVFLLMFIGILCNAYPPKED